MSDPKAFAQRLEGMDEEDRDHFRRVIEKLSHCYGQGAAKAVVLYLDPSLLITDALTINCDEMDSYEIIRGALDYFAFLNTQDAPPKEQFN